MLLLLLASSYCGQFIIMCSAVLRILQMGHCTLKGAPFAMLQLNRVASTRRRDITRWSHWWSQSFQRLVSALVFLRGSVLLSHSLIQLSANSCFMCLRKSGPGTPRDASGMLLPRFAFLSAASFPSIPQCDGTHIKVAVVACCCRACTHGCRVVAAARASIVLLESVITRIGWSLGAVAAGMFSAHVAMAGTRISEKYLNLNFLERFEFFFRKITLFLPF